MKFQAIVLASFLSRLMRWQITRAVEQDAAPPPPHAIEDGYRGTDDAKKMTVDFCKYHGPWRFGFTTCNLISHKGEDRYVFAIRAKLMSLFLRPL
ncbi:hypothetical protein ACLK1T_27350 [Escherichia coli]